MNDRKATADLDTSKPNSFFIRITGAAGNYVEISCNGRFDAVVAADVRALLSKPEIVAHDYIVFDVSEVTFIDSAGLAVLVRSRRDCMLRNGNVVLVGPRSHDARRIFELTQFDQIFWIVYPRVGTTHA